MNAPTPAGVVEVSVPKGSQPGRQTTVEGAGLAGRAARRFRSDDRDPWRRRPIRHGRANSLRSDGQGRHVRPEAGAGRLNGAPVAPSRRQRFIADQVGQRLDPVDVPEREVGCGPGRERAVRSPVPNARAALRVTPANASAGVSRNSVQAMFMRQRQGVVGRRAGLQSVATPSARHGGAGRSTGGSLRLAQEVERARQQHRDRAGRAPSPPRRPRRRARGGRPTARRTRRRAPRRRRFESCSACSLTGRPWAARPRTRAASAPGVKPIVSQNASTASARPGRAASGRIVLADLGRCSRRPGRRTRAAARARRAGRAARATARLGRARARRAALQLGPRAPGRSRT